MKAKNIQWRKRLPGWNGRIKHSELDKLIAVITKLEGTFRVVHYMSDAPFTEHTRLYEAKNRAQECFDEWALGWIKPPKGE